MAATKAEFPGLITRQRPQRLQMMLGHFQISNNYHNIYTLSILKDLSQRGQFFLTIIILKSKNIPKREFYEHNKFRKFRKAYQ